MHDHGMMRRIMRRTPTQRQWRKRMRHGQRRVPARTVKIVAFSFALVLTIGLQFLPHGVQHSLTEDVATKPTALRGGDAWKGLTSGSATPSGRVVGRVTWVRDGDTIEIAGRPIRFAKLDCAEMATRDGRRASERMRALVSSQTLSCRLTGRKSYDRWIGSCRLADGRDLAAVMVEDGFCSWWRG